MPFSPTKVFLEETSLVARPIIPFPELKLRLEKRMAHLGIKVRPEVAGGHAGGAQPAVSRAYQGWT
jgi:lycopene beta-cyclase